MKKFILWWKKNEASIIRTIYIIPILFAAFVSINHVIQWYSMTNPINWSIYLSIGIEVAALSALAGMLRHVNKNVYLPFIIVTFIQFVGNIFFAYQFIDVTSKLYQNWVELISFIVDPEDIAINKRILAIISGGLIPVISLSFLHLLVSFNEKEEKLEKEGDKKDEKENVVDVKEEEQKINNTEQKSKPVSSVTNDDEKSDDIFEDYGSFNYDDNNVTNIPSQEDYIEPESNNIEEQEISVDNDIIENVETVIDENNNQTKEEPIVKEVEKPVVRHTFPTQQHFTNSISQVSDSDVAMQLAKKRIKPNTGRNSR